MGKKLDGKVAVVTGAGRGIGRAEALALAAEGAKLVINDFGGARDGSGNDLAPADQVVAEIKKLGGMAVANHDSVATPEGGENIIKTAIDAFGRVDILVNNAGFLRDRMIFNMSLEEWDSIIKTHLYGTFYCTKPACAQMRKQRSGRIINTASLSGLGNMGQANYSAAKEGIVGFTRTVALDMGKYGVTCNAIRPDAATRLTLNEDLAEATRKAREAGIPGAGGSDTTAEEIAMMGPERVAPLVVYLATDQAANINGCTFYTGGGRIGIYQDPIIKYSIFKDGVWSLDELLDLIPKSLTKGIVNPSPPQPSK